MHVKPCTLKFCFYSSYIISNEKRKLVFWYWICNSEGWGKGSSKNISCLHASLLLGLLVIVIFLPCLSGKRENVFANIIGEWHSYLYRINMVINVWFSMWSNTFASGLVLAQKLVVWRKSKHPNLLLLVAVILFYFFNSFHILGVIAACMLINTCIHIFSTPIYLFW